MKKKWLILLILSIALLGFTACQKEPVSPAAATHEVPSQDRQPTDVSSQALEQEESEPQVVSAEKVSATSSRVDQATSEASSTVSKVPSIASSPSVSSGTEDSKKQGDSISFVQRKQENREDGVAWQSIYSTEPTQERSVFTKVDSSEQLKQILVNQQLSSHTVEEALQEFPATFFEENTLLLIEWMKADTSLCLLVKEMYIKDDTLYIALEETQNPGGGKEVVASAIYPVEVQEELDKVQRVRCTVTRKYQHKTETFTEDWK